MRLTEAFEFLHVPPAELMDRKEGFSHLTLTVVLWDLRRKMLREKGERQLSFMEERYE